MRPSDPLDVRWNARTLKHKPDSWSHELSSKANLLIISAVKHPHICNTFNIFASHWFKNNLETGFLSVQSVYFYSFHFSTRTLGRKETSQLVPLLFSPYHTSLFIFIWLPFLWSSIIHICIYIVRRNLVEWQWLFFVWIVNLWTLSKQDTDSSLLYYPYLLICLFLHALSVFFLSLPCTCGHTVLLSGVCFLANRLSPPPLCVTCSWAESAGCPRSWMPGYRQVPGPNRGLHWAAGICTWPRKFPKGIVPNISSLFRFYTHCLCSTYSWYSMFNFHSHLYVFIFILDTQLQFDIQSSIMNPQSLSVTNDFGVPPKLTWFTLDLSGYLQHLQHVVIAMIKMYDHKTIGFILCF